MNQLIVILLILKNWFRPFRTTAFKIGLCLCGLLLSFYIYHVYNQIPHQRIKIGLIEEGVMDTVSARDVDITLDYGDLRESHYFTLLDSVPRSGTTISLRSLYNWNSFTKPIHTVKTQNDNITFYSSHDIIQNLYSTNMNERIRSNFESAPQYTYFYAIMDYQENNWIFPHPKDRFRVRKSSIADPIITRDKISKNDINVLQFQEIPIRENSKYSDSSLFPFSFKRKKHYFLYESIFAGEEYLALLPTITSPQRFYAPHFYNSYDVSKLELSIDFNIDTLSSFTIYFLNLVDISEIHPSPDVKDPKMLSYTDPEKLNNLINKGLSLYIHFPKSESLQESRNYVLSAIITLFLTLISTLLFNRFKEAYHQRKRYVNTVKKTYSNHPIFAFLATRHLILYDIVVSTIIVIIIMICNPYDYRVGEIIILSMSVITLLPLYLYCMRLYCMRLRILDSNIVIKQNYYKSTMLTMLLSLIYIILISLCFLAYKTYDINDILVMAIGSIVFIIILMILTNTKRKK